MDSLMIVAVFGMIGAGLKYIDEAFDEDIFDRRKAAALAPLLILLWTGISILDTTAATILFSILAGVLLTGKIDNTVFKLSALALLGALVFINKLLIAPLILLTLTGIIDELGNDYADTHEMSKASRFFFLHRFSMKLGVATLCYLGIFQLIYLAAFLVFDTAYDTIALLGMARTVSMERGAEAQPHT